MPRVLLLSTRLSCSIKRAGLPDLSFLPAYGEVQAGGAASGTAAAAAPSTPKAKASKAAKQQ
jgi:hypothetical protein